MAKDPWRLKTNPLHKNRSAGLGRRSLAALADIILIIFLIFTPFAGFMDGRLEQVSGYELSEFSTQLSFALFIIVLLTYSYFVLFHYYYGQTVGMMLLQIKVRQELGLWQCMVKSLIALPFFPFYMLWISEPLLLTLGKKPLLERLTGSDVTVQA